MSTAKLEVAFGVNATSDPTSGQWIDVTQYMRTFDIARGRQRDLDRIEAGTMTVVLNNRDRRFDPENASGPYYPNITPLQHIRFSVDGSYLFRGFTDAWQPSYPAQGRDAILTVPCSDAFAVLANLRMPGSVWERKMRINLAAGVI